MRRARAAPAAAGLTAPVQGEPTPGAIGFSSFAVLTYYAIANASAWTLAPEQRRWSRPLAAAGLFGCGVLAFTLPTASIVTGAVVLGVGAFIWLVRTLRRGTGRR